LSSNISIINNTILQELILINDQIEIAANLNQTSSFKKLIELFDPSSSKKKLANESLPAL